MSQIWSRWHAYPDQTRCLLGLFAIRSSRDIHDATPAQKAADFLGYVKDTDQPNRVLPRAGPDDPQ